MLGGDEKISFLLSGLCAAAVQTMSVALDAVKLVTPPVLVEYRRYWKAFGRLPNLVRPTRLTERILARKLFERDPLHTMCADKFLVRDYVARRVGARVLAPLLFETTKPYELYNLPRWAGTVIKPNHASMAVEMLPSHEPGAGDKSRIVERCEEWLRMDFSRLYNEWHYRGIRPRILVEQFVGDHTRKAIEIKVHCFARPGGGVTHLVQLVGDRFGVKAMAFYIEGGPEGHTRVRTNGAEPPGIDELNPGQITDAVALSTQLSGEFDYVRVDWLASGSRLFFSELTFTPGAGLSTSFGDALDRQAGSLWYSRPNRCRVSVIEGVSDSPGVLRAARP